jgi:hypothetical protein
VGFPIDPSNCSHFDRLSTGPSIQLKDRLFDEDRLRAQCERIIRNRKGKVNLFIYEFPLTILGDDSRAGGFPITHVPEWFYRLNFK